MTAFQKWVVLVSSILTGATGIVYWVMDTLLDPVDPWAVINHPLQPLVLKLHILAAPVLVFAVGLIATDHIWRHFRGQVRFGRRSGILTFAVLGPMVASGYLVQAVTAPVWLTVVAWTHVLTSAIYLIGLATHQVVVTRRGPGRPENTAAS